VTKKQFFSKKQRRDIFDQAIQFWDNSTRKMSDFFGRVNDFDRLYHVQLPQELHDAFKNEPSRSAMVLPDIFNNVRSFKAHMAELIFGTKPYATVSILGQPNQRNEVVDKAEVVLSALVDISKFKKETNKIIQQVCVAGTSACLTDWYRRRYREVARDEALFPIMEKNGQFKFVEKVVAEYPRMTGLDIRRARIDDKAETRENIRLVGYHARQNLSELIKFNNDPRSFVIFDEKEVRKSSFPHNEYFEYVTEEMPEKEHDKSPYGDRPVEVIEVRGMFQVDDNFVDLIVKIVNRDIVIEARPNNLPCYGWETMDFPSLDAEFNKIFTMGLIEPAEDVFYEQFIKRNQSIDASNRGTYPMYIGDLTATHDLNDKMEYIGGKIHKVNLAASGSTSVSNVLAPLPIAENPIDTFNQSERLKSDTQQTMRRSDYSQGIDPSRKETATAVNELTSAGIRDIKQAVNYLGESFLFPVWSKYLKLWDFKNGNRENQVETPEGKRIIIRPNELNKPFEFSVDISAALDRPVVTRRIIETLPFFSQAPETDKYWLLKTVSWLLQLPNQDKILPPPNLKIADVERENLALRMGIQQPVHPADDHAFHIKIHTQRAQADADDPGFNLTDDAINAYNNHIQSHNEQLAQINNPTGINTPKLTSGANTGMMSGGAAPRIKNTNLSGTTPG